MIYYLNQHVFLLYILKFLYILPLEEVIFGHIFQFLYFAILFKIRNLKKLSLFKGDENFFQ